MATDLSSPGKPSIAIMFPGQGSQFAGMGSDLLAQDIDSKSILETANNVLGYSLSQVMEGKRGDSLNQTAYTQPAIFVHSMMIWSLIKKSVDIRPTVALGHSLGEYSALCAAGVLGFEDALELVRVRSEAMQNAQPSGSCGMAAVIGVSHERIMEIISSEKQESCLSIANYNSPDQVVISGAIQSLDRAIERLSKEKRSRVVRLPVSSAFHTELMLPAVNALETGMQKVAFSNALIPVIANCNAQIYPDRPDETRTLLLRQLVAPVLWESCIRKAIDMGVNLFLEIGPGKVLSGLVKRIDRSVSASAIQDLQSLRDVLGATA